MLFAFLQRRQARKHALVCPKCLRDASPANFARGRTILRGDLTCEYCDQTSDVAGWRLSATSPR